MFEKNSLSEQHGLDKKVFAHGSKKEDGLFWCEEEKKKTRCFFPKAWLL